MDPQAAAGELRYIRDVLARTERRVDPQAFHYVHWGVIVLVWYPLMNWLGDAGRDAAQLWTSVVALGLGVVLSTVGGWRRGRAALPGENTFVARQVVRVTVGALVAAAVLSAVGPATGVISGERIPIVWGLAYAVMAYNLGVVYRREFLWSGVAIFAGTLVAMALPAVQGYVLGPVMGLGMIIPGAMAERRVRQMRAEAV